MSLPQNLLTFYGFEEDQIPMELQKIEHIIERVEDNVLLSFEISHIEQKLAGL